MDIGFSKYLAQDAGIAGVGKILIDGVSDEIEKGLEQRVAEFPGGLFGALTESVQKSHDLIGCYEFQLPVTELPVENGKQDFIVSSGAFFLNLPGDIQDNNEWRSGLSLWTSSRNGLGGSSQIAGGVLLFQYYTNTWNLTSGGHGKDVGLNKF
jgi:hypothetical protein